MTRYLLAVLVLVVAAVYLARGVENVRRGVASVDETKEPDRG